MGEAGGTETWGGRAGLGPRITPGGRGAVSVGHWVFSASCRCLQVANMTAAGQSLLAPLLETLEDRSASCGEHTDAYLALAR